MQNFIFCLFDLFIINILMLFQNIEILNLYFENKLLSACDYPDQNQIWLGGCYRSKSCFNCVTKVVKIYILLLHTIYTYTTYCNIWFILH